MRIEYINPFVGASIDILEEVLASKVDRGNIFLRPSNEASMGYAVLIGMTGQVTGRILLEMTEETAVKISNVMLGESYETMVEMAQSAISEIGNMIAGRAITKLHNLGFVFEITPPTLVKGDHMEISTPSLEAVIVPLETPHGRVEVNVALKEDADGE